MARQSIATVCAPSGTVSMNSCGGKGEVSERAFEAVLRAKTCTDVSCSKPFNEIDNAHGRCKKHARAVDAQTSALRQHRRSVSGWAIACPPRRMRTRRQRSARGSG